MTVLCSCDDNYRNDLHLPEVVILPLPFRWRSVFGLVRACVGDHKLKVCWHSILQTARGNFTKLHLQCGLGQK